MRWRTKVDEADCEAIRGLVAATGFFSAEEVEIAVELVAETVAGGKESDYRFVVLDSDEQDGTITAYACYGRIPLTQASFDLYWIAVAPDAQRSGLGRETLQQAEAAAREEGATTMYVDTSGRDQYRPTRSFYERAGYSVAARFTDFYAPGDDKIIYSKRL
ncbi:MAG TPA: GNAT family N-acetyltransferase [Woeseiaceae bacterium]|nr:GNAT family N-acetyltransferase [Woeseiaceae bacterium]